MKTYTLKKKANSNELHLFACEKDGTSCTCEQLSVCGRMNKSDQTGLSPFVCEQEDEARMKAAAFGRVVCAQCITVFYTTH